MNSTDYKTGWTENVWIEVKSTSDYGFIDDFKCGISEEPLNEESLFVSRINFKHRGNETDEAYFYNREHTPEKYKPVWEQWDKKKLEIAGEIKRLAKDHNISVNLKIQ